MDSQPRPGRFYQIAQLVKMVVILAFVLFMLKTFAGNTPWWFVALIVLLAAIQFGKSAMYLYGTFKSPAQGAPGPNL